MADSKIEWTDKVYNPVTGCTQISAGCKNCYAKKMANRLKGMGLNKYRNGFEVTCHPDALDEPLGWRKSHRIFVCSMGDLFHEDVPDDFIEKVFSVIYDLPHHIFMILTKRPERMKAFFDNSGRHSMAFLSEALSIPHNNLYLGVSVENQETADLRIPLLLQTPAAKRFVSYEPAIGAVSFMEWLFEPTGNFRTHKGKQQYEMRPASRLDQIIMGGESGPGARPLHPDWARSVRDQCAEAGVPFFFKQWGEWKVETRKGTTVEMDSLKSNQRVGAGDGRTNHTLYTRVGKKETGHLIDGKEHRELI